MRLLSGGERRRLQLALVLRQGPNVLLLDEPTNDLDLDTLRALEDLLDAWPGTLVVVSHDRAFLERTVEDVVVLDRPTSAPATPPGSGGCRAATRPTRRPAGPARVQRPGRSGDAALRRRPRPARPGRARRAGPTGVRRRARRPRCGT